MKGPLQWRFPVLLPTPGTLPVLSGTTRDNALHGDQNGGDHDVWEMIRVPVREVVGSAIP